MKKNIIHKLVLPLFFVTLVFSGCEDALDIESESRVDPNGHIYNTTDDNAYIITSILGQLQKIGERYVLLGELRGDLMDVTPEASSYLRQIYNFEVTNGNPFANSKDYYAVINNCNYIINHIDTSVVFGGQKIMMQGYAAVKAYRAWVYMQLALNYKEAVWLEKPLLVVDDLSGDTLKYDIVGLANRLIPDLAPLVDVPYYSGALNELYFPIRFLLGELYLWTGQYENAATEYRNLLNKYSTNSDGTINLITFQSYYRWTVLNGEIVKGFNYSTLQDNFITSIITSSEKWEGSHLMEYARHTSFGGKYWIKPSVTAIKNWDSAFYYDPELLGRNYGDFRGLCINYSSLASANEPSVSDNHTNSLVFNNNGKSIAGYDNYISKYIYRYTKSDGNDYVYERIGIISPALIYLRYAEAVNQLRKPNLAFAVLKYGLSTTIIANNAYVPLSEKSTPLPVYMDFSNSGFLDNIGIHAHGCGDTDKDPRYKIPVEDDIVLENQDDSIDYVEDLIVKELALETAFNGNRFHDLMRVAIRRDDNSYLADKVAKKHGVNESAIKTLLMIRDNWYLPKN